ncbi:MAG: hypothetical protein R3321_10475, partial [Nitrososphaeraceae archaeon]|nr:hypothetical protein [Nitrososphaeraceae archaeon]
IYPIGPIYISLNNAIKDVITFHKSFKHNKLVRINKDLLIFPITLNKTYPLKKEYWSNPSIRYSQFDRLKQFSKILSNYNFYNLIVTPLNYQNLTLLISAIPFPITATDRDIGNFMMKSDFPVDETAKDAANYSIEEPISYNYNTGKLSSSKSKHPSYSHKLN